MILSDKRSQVWLRRIRRFVMTTIIGGLVVALPVTLFILIVRLIFNFITSTLAPIGRILPFSDDTAIWLVQLISLIIIILFFFLIGLLVRTRSGKDLIQNMEDHLSSRLPLYKVIRDTVRQFVGTEKMPFSQVVLADVFGNGTLMTGFVTDELGNGYFSIFVPTAPNPTNGFVFHVHESNLKFLDTKPEDAMRSVIGLGIGSNVVFKSNEFNIKKPN